MTRPSLPAIGTKYYRLQIELNCTRLSIYKLDSIRGASSFSDSVGYFIRSDGHKMSMYMDYVDSFSCSDLWSSLEKIEAALPSLINYHLASTYRRIKSLKVNIKDWNREIKRNNLLMKKPTPPNIMIYLDMWEKIVEEWNISKVGEQEYTLTHSLDKSETKKIYHHQVDESDYYFSSYRKTYEYCNNRHQEAINELKKKWNESLRHMEYLKNILKNPKETLEFLISKLSQ